MMLPARIPGRKVGRDILAKSTVAAVLSNHLGLQETVNQPGTPQKNGDTCGGLNHPKTTQSCRRIANTDWAKIDLKKYADGGH